MARASEFRGGRHVIYNLQAHLVCMPKYRRALINERVFSLPEAAWRQVCTGFECELRETG